jgi:hypothetical protein
MHDALGHGAASAFLEKLTQLQQPVPSFEMDEFKENTSDVRHCCYALEYED